MFVTTNKREIMENQTPTIKDVAKMAGVSIATVDRVLHKRGKVSQKNQKSIEAALEILSYKPNQIARALSGRKSSIKIGVTYSSVDEEFWSEIVSGVEAARNQLQPFGVELVTDYSKSFNIEDQINSIDRIVNQGVSGIVMTPYYDGSSSIFDEHIPVSIPYITVINDTFGGKRLFHIGPDDFAIGSTAARLLSFFVKENSSVVILAPNSISGETQQRISGFVSKIKQEPLNLNILQTVSVPGTTEDVIYKNPYIVAKRCIESFPRFDAFYVTNGMTEWCADAVLDTGNAGKIKVIGHEFTKKMPEYLNSGLISASIYQKPAQQFYNAILMLYDVLKGMMTVPTKNVVTECSILMKETLPYVKIGGTSFY